MPFKWQNENENMPFKQQKAKRAFTRTFASQDYGVSRSWFEHTRSSHRGCSVGKGVFRNFAKFTRKHLCQSLFLNKIAGLRPAALLKKRLRHRYFLVNFEKFLRTPFLRNTSERLLLYLTVFPLKLSLHKQWSFPLKAHSKVGDNFCHLKVL